MRQPRCRNVTYRADRGSSEPLLARKRQCERPEGHEGDHRCGVVTWPQEPTIFIDRVTGEKTTKP
jgi:hypothetical protein